MGIFATLQRSKVSALGVQTPIIPRNEAHLVYVAMTRDNTKWSVNANRNADIWLFTKPSKL